MMTNYEISTWFYKQLKESELSRSVSGIVSKTRRPVGSKAEDIIIKVLSNDGCGQMQRAFVNINIYIQDKYNGETKSWEEDSRRIGILSKACEFLFSLHGDGLKVFDTNSSQSVFESEATHEDGLSEHYINNKLYIEINNE